MNPKFVHDNIKMGDTIRVTTKFAVGVIGKVSEIAVTDDGLVLEEVKDEDLAKKIDNPMPYEKALFAISDIKYIFVLDLTTKPTK